MVESSEGKGNVSSLDGQEKINANALGTAPPTSCASDARKVPSRKAAVAGKYFCTVCSVNIYGTESMTKHHESKRHRANMKRLVKQQKNIDPTDYQENQCSLVVDNEGTVPSSDGGQPSVDMSGSPKLSADVSETPKAVAEKDANSEPTADGGDTIKATEPTGVNGGNGYHGLSSVSSRGVETSAIQVMDRIYKAARQSSLNRNAKLDDIARRHLRQKGPRKLDGVSEKEKQCRYFEAAQPENLAVVGEKKANDSRYFQVAKHRASRYRVAHFNKARFNKYTK